jgi:hypothetical protein
MTLERLEILQMQVCHVISMRQFGIQPPRVLVEVIGRNYEVQIVQKLVAKQFEMERTEHVPVPSTWFQHLLQRHAWLQRLFGEPAMTYLPMKIVYKYRVCPHMAVQDGHTEFLVDVMRE